MITKRTKNSIRLGVVTAVVLSGVYLFASAGGTQTNGPQGPPPPAFNPNAPHPVWTPHGLAKDSHGNVIFVTPGSPPVPSNPHHS